MAKKKGRHAKGGRTTPKGTRPLGSRSSPGGGWGDRPPQPPHLSLVPDPFDGPAWDESALDESFDDEDGPPVADLAEALSTGEPLDLLAQVSGIVAVFDWQRESPFPTPGEADEDEDMPTLADLVRILGEVDQPESNALLAVVAELAKEDWVRSRARRASNRRRHRLPEWIQGLGAAGVDRCVEQVHVLGDGDNLMLEISLPTGEALTAVVYIDHHLGTVVKDAYVVADGIDALIALMRQVGADDENTEWRELDLADARRRIVDANQHADITWPPYETETWPACRPLVEFALRRLPEGGRPYERHEWTDAERDALEAEVLASPFVAGFDTEHDPDLLDSLLWYGTGYGTGDPLRWSPVSVELVLADWLPRKIVAPVAHLQRAPDVLRALIRFGHDRLGIPAALTDETLAAVDAWEPDYQRAIRSPRPQGPEALLAAMGAMDGDAAIDPALIARLAGELGDEFGDDDWYDDRSYAEMMLGDLRAAVGGNEVLAALDDDPLPDEPLDLAGVPADVVDRVVEISALADDACGALLDVEHRTAARRFLADVARADPAIFRRKAKVETAAAAVCWTVVEANRVGSYGGITTRELNDHLGVGTSSNRQRATTMLKAIGVDPYRYGQPLLGTTRYLVAERRRSLIEQRDRYQAMDDADE